MAGVVPHVLKKIRSRCTQMPWKRAAEHYCGEGIGEDAALTAHLKIRKELKKAGDHKSMGILDMTAQGAAWPPGGPAATDQEVSPECEFCKNGVEGTCRHQAWECPVIRNGIGSSRDETKEYEDHVLGGELAEDAARRSWARARPPPQCQAFWCRGILPKAGTGPLWQLLGTRARPHEVKGDMQEDGFINLRLQHGTCVTTGSDGSG